MATLIERFYAALDRGIHRTFWMSHGWSSGSEGSHYETYWSGFGQKFAVVQPDGTVSTLGNSWWIQHHYDDKGNLMSRRRMVKTAKPQDKVVYGFQAVYAAYAKKPRPYVKFPRL